MQPKNTIPFGYCHCGCGQKTKLASKTSTRRGWIKGQPLRFLHNHHSKRIRKQVRYKIVDAGYKTPCWLWSMHLSDTGYGKVRSGNTYTGAHRFMYEKFIRPIPKGLVLDHLCSNRSCVNPEHLEPVTFTENLRRGRSTRLSPESAKEIKRLRGVEGAPTVAKRYGVTPSTIYAIWHGKTWKD